MVRSATARAEGAPDATWRDFPIGRAEDATSLDWLAICREPRCMAHAGSTPGPRRALSGLRRAASRLRYRITRFRIYDCADCALVYLWPRLDEREVREMFARLYTEGEGSVPELRSYYDFTYEDAPDNPLVQLYERWLDAHRGACARRDACSTSAAARASSSRWRAAAAGSPTASTTAPRPPRTRAGTSGSRSRTASSRDFAARGPALRRRSRCGTSSSTRATPVGLLAAARGVLAPGGVIGISTPNQRSILDVVAGAIYRASGGRVTWPLEKFYIEQHFLYFTPATLARRARARRARRSCGSSASSPTCAG